METVQSVKVAQKLKHVNVAISLYSTLHKQLENSIFVPNATKWARANTAQQDESDGKEVSSQYEP